MDNVHARQCTGGAVGKAAGRAPQDLDRKGIYFEVETTILH
jgi:hypothetical protein